MLYASSRSAQGTAGPDFRRKMEGLQYSDLMLAGWGTTVNAAGTQRGE